MGELYCRCEILDTGGELCGVRDNPFITCSQPVGNGINTLNHILTTP